MPRAGGEGRRRPDKGPEEAGVGAFSRRVGTRGACGDGAPHGSAEAQVCSRQG